MDISRPNFEDPDGFYAALLQAHEGLSEADSALLNAKLVMLLANQVGNASRLQALIDAAREDVAPGAP